MTRWNKASISAIIGALATVFAVLWPDMLSTEKLAAIQGAITTLLVYAVPNVDPDA